MKICSYNSPATDHKYHNKSTGCIYLYMLLSERLINSIDHSWSLYIMDDVSTWSNEAIINNFKKIYRYAANQEEEFGKIDQLVKLNKDANHLKHKDKFAMTCISHYKSMVNRLRGEALAYREELLTYNHIKELWPFIDEGIWKLEPIDFIQEPNKEHELIKPITNIITNREYIFSFESDVEDLFDFSTLDSNEESTFDFIKIPMWHLPPLDNMPYAKMKYSREDLQQDLVPFYLQLSEFTQEIFNIPFSNKNAQEFKILFEKDLNKHIAKVQKCIDESLYLNNMKNQFPSDKGLMFNLGIASAETLINYYERTQNIEPYMASEIKQQVSRYVNLNASYVFTYYTANLPLSVDYKLNEQ